MNRQAADVFSDARPFIEDLDELAGRHYRITNARKIVAKNDVGVNVAFREFGEHPVALSTLFEGVRSD
jgi:hypothetical protein